MPDVSIIVPVYNAENTVSRCIESILSQSFTNFELILVNDGSPDSSGHICNRYSTADNRIQTIHQANSGVSAARNTGLAIARGKYVLFVDSDDYLDSNFISQLFSQKSDLTICGIETRDETGRFLYHTQYTPVSYSAKTDINFPQLYKELQLYAPYCKLFRRDLIEDHHIRFVPDITWGEDGMFVADYLQYINSLRVIPYTGYFYVKYADNQSLSTRVREDIVEMVVASREYCIKKMMLTAPSHFDAVKEICTDDLRWNCVYFVNRFLRNINGSKKERIRILKRFLASPHVIFTMKNPEKYYPRLAEIYSIMKTADPLKIINKQTRLHRKSECIALIGKARACGACILKKLFAKKDREE